MASPGGKPTFAKARMNGKVAPDTVIPTTTIIKPPEFD
jgi:hypothetical protein